MFKPLHQAISMLKKQGQNIEDIVVAGNVPILEYLEAAPQVWRSTHRRMLDKKESITGKKKIFFFIFQNFFHIFNMLIFFDFFKIYFF